MLRIVDHLRRRFARFELGAHFLQARSKRLNLLLLACDGRFLPAFLRCSLRNSLSNMAFTVFVTNGVNLAVVIADDQVGINLGYFFGDQTIFRPLFLVTLVVKLTGLSARMASLALFIGLMSFLNRREELCVPS